MRIFHRILILTYQVLKITCLAIGTLMKESGALVSDMSGNGLTGQIFGATWTDDVPFGLCKPNNLWVEAGNEENVLQWSQPGSDVNLSFADYTITSLPYIHQGNTDGAGNDWPTAS